MANNPFIDVQITRQTRVTARQGFGVPLIFTVSAPFSGVRSYSSIEAVLEDFADTEEAFKLAAAMFAQELVPETVKIAKRPNLASLATELAAIINTDNDWYALLLDTDAQADVLAAAAFIEALGATNSKIFFCLLREADVVDATVTDTAALLAAFGYDRTVIFFTKPNTIQVVSMVFSADVITGNTIDGEIDGVPIASVPFNTSHFQTLNDLATVFVAHADIASAVVGGPSNRTITITMEALASLEFTDFLITGGASQATINVNETTPEDSTREGNRNHAAWVGGQLPKDPGSITWKFKELKTQIADQFTDNEVVNVESKDTNIYREIGGLGVTSEGVVASGEFIDVIHGVDFVNARMTERIFDGFVSADKIPFTDAGVDVTKGFVREIIQLGIAQGIFAATPEPTITAPLVSQISAADKAARRLPDVKWQATLAGAIHKTVVRGTVSL